MADSSWNTLFVGNAQRAMVDSLSLKKMLEAWYFNIRELRSGTCDVWNFFNENLHQKWIGRCLENDLAFLKWPSRSPLTYTLRFISLGLCEGQSLYPTNMMPQALEDSNCSAVASINQYGLIGNIPYNLVL